MKFLGLFSSSEDGGIITNEPFMFFLAVILRLGSVGCFLAAYALKYRHHDQLGAVLALLLAVFLWESANLFLAKASIER